MNYYLPNRKYSYGNAKYFLEKGESIDSAHSHHDERCLTLFSTTCIETQEMMLRGYDPLTFSLPSLPAPIAFGILLPSPL